MNETELFSLEAERALLALLVNVSSVDGVGAARLLLEREQLRAGDFHLLVNGAAYTAIQTLLARGLPADPVALFDAMRQSEQVAEAGGLKWMLELASAGDALLSVSFPGFARTVREFAVRRRLVLEAKALQMRAANLANEVGDVLATTNSQLASIVFRQDTFRSLAEVMDSVQKEIQAGQEKETRLLPTGIQRLDRLIGGLPPFLIVVGARPGTGKSALCATLTETVGQGGTKIGVFSLEDRASWLAYRLLSANSNVPNFKLRFRKLDGDEWVRTGEGFQKVGRYHDRVLVDDRRRQTPVDIQQSARNMIVNHGVRCILIDHLLEVKPRKEMGRRDLEVADALSVFRDLANEYELPVVVFTQLNRGAESKNEPSMLDFKDAGAVEEMARVAIAMRRPDGGDKIELHVIKNTNGLPGKTEVEFVGAAAMVAAVEKQRNLYDER